jgi:Tn3 transposase DDE domain
MVNKVNCGSDTARARKISLERWGLAVNVIVLWNTLYINAALEQLAREGHHVTPEDVARLSPLVFEHINLLGRYAFSVPEAVTRGELRPSRNPDEALEEVP